MVVSIHEKVCVFKQNGEIRCCSLIGYQECNVKIQSHLVKKSFNFTRSSEQDIFLNENHFYFKLVEKAVPQILQSSAKKKTEYKIRSNLRQIFYSGAPTRRRRVSRAPSPKKFGKHIETRKFDVTVRTSVCTDSKGSEWSLKVTLTGKFKNAMFSWWDF